MIKTSDVIHKGPKDLTRAESLVVAQALQLYLSADKEDVDSFDKLSIKLTDGRSITYIDKMKMNLVDGETVVLMAEVAEMKLNGYYERVFASVNWGDDNEKIEIVKLLDDDSYKNVLMRYAQNEELFTKKSTVTRRERFTKNKGNKEGSSPLNLPPL